MTNEYVKLVAFLTAVEMTDVDLSTIKQHQIDNIREVLKAEIQSTIELIQDEIGDAEKCIMFVEILRGFYEAQVELDIVEAELEFVIVDIFVDDQESTPLEVLKLDPKEHGIAGSPILMDWVASYVGMCVSVGSYGDMLQVGDTIRFECRGTGYYGEIKIEEEEDEEHVEKLTLPDVLTDYGRWAGHRQVEDTKDVSPETYIRESKFAAELHKSTAREFLQTFYTRETAGQIIEELYG